MLLQLSLLSQAIRFTVILCGFLALPQRLHAQSSIEAHPDAQQLQMIWEVEGDDYEFAGKGIGGLWDIYGTGTNAWAILKRGGWHIYNGYTGDSTRDTVEVQKITLGGGMPPDRFEQHPIIGDFWGTGSKAIAFGTTGFLTTNEGERAFARIRVYRTESKRIDSVPAAVLEGHLMKSAEIYNELYTAPVADMDNDGDDELIVPWSYQPLLGGTGAELWLYSGGPDFQLNTPTQIVPVPAGGTIRASTGDFDGDAHADILVTVEAEPPVMILYFGDETLAGLSRPENRRIITNSRFHGDITVLDCDGDGISDIAANVESDRVEFFRSRTAKNSRTRTYSSSDADNIFGSAGASVRKGGYLNDSTGRFDMALLLGTSDVKALSGGINGPDNLYDAFFSDSAALLSPAPDINGDGWDDLITGNWFPNYQGGFARVFAGGPHIPRDPMTGVQSVPSEDHQAAISTWPNPVRDELNIAWRGDLKRMPHQFFIHDISGREIARGTVDPRHGAALWKCGDVPPGSYLLDILDTAGRRIATAQIVKCE